MNSSKAHLIQALDDGLEWRTRRIECKFWHKTSEIFLSIVRLLVLIKNFKLNKKIINS